MVVKGGVWTNVEDVRHIALTFHCTLTNSYQEVLKAAVSKYGRKYFPKVNNQNMRLTFIQVNQWSRISSLLARKSSKACKARWNEWLDPKLVKTEWSSDEKEQLLHLARSLPNQWRTISNILGRTVAASLETYEKLMQQAEEAEGGLSLSGPSGSEHLTTAEDVRKLGNQQDYTPEARPAKPDSVDMDEEYVFTALYDFGWHVLTLDRELEMLSEARARLANTSGKKMKRKAREREMEVSKRTAALAKRRELKQAGINIKLKTKPPKGAHIDYGSTDIPLERTVPSGFYDTEAENNDNERQREAFDPRKQQLSNKRKGEIEDGKEERKRQKNDKSGESISAAAMKAAQMQKIREAEQSSKRRALVLPAPQVGEGELEDIVKMGMSGERAVRGAGTDNDATRGLVSNYSMAAATPIRTPMAAPENDRIATELQNIRALTGSNSALLGGENTPLAEISKSHLNSTATPNPLATPFRGGIGATPVGATPLRTPRDNFNLNRDTNGSGQTLLSKLAALPKAKELEFELEAPEEVEEAANLQLSEEDAAIRDARDKQIRDAAELAEFNRQTQVIQKRLPRPAVIDIDAMLKNAGAIPDDIRRRVAIETALIIGNDAFKFGGTRVSGSSRPVEIYNDEALQTARWEVALEQSSDKTRKQKGDFDTAFAEIHSAAKLPGLDGYYEDEIDEHQMMVEVFDVSITTFNISRHVI
jgi:pre-mRNA-splicing factor CDC5/CEF1